MNTRRPRTPRPWLRPLLGVAIALAGIVAVYVSYNSSKGLPFQSIFHLTVEVPNGDELNQGDNVQIGGARVGMVATIAAVPDGAHPYTRIRLNLDGNPHLAADSTVSIQPLSILGEKTVVIQRGHGARELTDGATLALAQARSVVDLNAALSTFNPATRAGIQGTLAGLAAGVAGRGNDINATLTDLAALLPNLATVSNLLRAPATDLGGFIDASAQFMSALEPVASQTPQLLGHAATTFSALTAAQPQFARLIDDAGPSELATTRALDAADPALSELRTLAGALTPASRQLHPALTGLAGALSAGTTAVQRMRALAGPLQQSATALLNTVPPRTEALAESLEELEVTVRDVSRIGAVVGPAQEDCNVLGTTLRNGADVIGEGDAQGSWFTFLPLITPFLLSTGSESSDTHVNQNPIEDARACVAGNEPYLAGPVTSNPPAADLTTAHDSTSPPAAATAQARAAGLLTPVPGARLR